MLRASFVLFSLLMFAINYYKVMLRIILLIKARLTFVLRYTVLCFKCIFWASCFMNILFFNIIIQLSLIVIHSWLAENYKLC